MTQHVSHATRPRHGLEMVGEYPGRNFIHTGGCLASAAKTANCAQQAVQVNIQVDYHCKPHIYDAYLVRLWRDSQQSPWRASAQSVEDGEIIHFSNLAALCAFLELRSTDGK